jgi:hypothetical protein
VRQYRLSAYDNGHFVIICVSYQYSVEHSDHSVLVEQTNYLLHEKTHSTKVNYYHKMGNRRCKRRKADRSYVWETPLAHY